MTKEEIIEECRQRLGFETDYEMYSLCQHEKDFYNAIIKVLEQPTRMNCKYRHENGNCMEIGGFCTSVDDKYCKYTTSNDCVSRAEVLSCRDTIRDMADGKIKNVVYIDDIEALPPVTPKQRWIPVSERLPKPNLLVNCYISTGATETYFIALWNDNQKDWEEGIGGYRLLKRDLGYEVLAWQPLPKPYEEKRGNSNGSS